MEAGQDGVEVNVEPVLAVSRGGNGAVEAAADALDHWGGQEQGGQSKHAEQQGKDGAKKIVSQHRAEVHGPVVAELLHEGLGVTLHALWIRLGGTFHVRLRLGHAVTTNLYGLSVDFFAGLFALSAAEQLTRRHECKVFGECADECRKQAAHVQPLR